MMNKKNILPLVILVFVASGFFYRQAFKTGVVTEKISGSDDGSGSVKEKPTISTGTKNTLDLSNQNLDKLPIYVLKLSNLKELNISNNKIVGALPAEIHDLRKLRVLDASNNLMTGVPAEVGQLENLEILNLSNNKLTGLPYELGNLKKLKVLNLSGNDYAKQDLEIIKKYLSPEVEIVL